MLCILVGNPKKEKQIQEKYMCIAYQKENILQTIESNAVKMVAVVLNFSYDKSFISIDLPFLNFPFILFITKTILIIVHFVFLLHLPEH